MIKCGKGRAAEGICRRANELLKESDNVYIKNMALNILEIIEKRTVLKSKPQVLCVILTDKCNLNCLMCYQKHTGYEISDELCAQVENLFPYLDRIVWMGGEVFLTKKFERLYVKASSYKYLSQSIVTNGQLIDGRWAKILTGYFGGICISIDGVTKETYEKIRVGAKYEKLLENIRLINFYREKADV